MRRDRLFLLFLLLLSIGGFAWLTSTSREEEMSKLTQGSSFRSDPHGSRALFLLARRLGLSVQRLQQDPRFLPPETSLLFVLTPYRLSPRFSDVYLRWLKEKPDRTLVFASHTRSPLYRAFSISVKPLGLTKTPDQATDPSFPKKRFRPDGSLVVSFDPEAPPPKSKRPPSSREIEERLSSPITFPFSSFVSLPKQALSLYSSRNKTMIALLPHHQSRVFLFSSPWFLSNEGLPLEKNLALVSQILQRFGSKGLILFDEIHHGYIVERGVVEYLVSLGLQPFLLHLLFALLLLLWWGSSRPGPDHPTPEEAPSPFSHPVTALAGLYRRAKATPHALHLLLWDFHQLLRSAGWPPSSLTPDTLPPDVLPPLSSQISSSLSFPSLPLHQESLALLRQLYALRQAPVSPSSQELLSLARRIDSIRVSLLPSSSPLSRTLSWRSLDAGR